MKLAILLAALITMLAGCASSHSVVEESPLPKIPAFYASHSDGIVTRPTDAEVAQAVQFGSAGKDNPSVVKDTYLSKAETSALASEAFYIVVRTPLYLIARHALERAKAGRTPDPNYIAFARRLGFVKLAVSERFISLPTWDALAIARDLSLLRDGVRVKAASSIPAWNGVDPFFDPDDPLASWQSTSWLKHGVEDMELQSLRQSQESAAQTSGAHGRSGQRAASIALAPGATIFSIEDLRKPGRYEIVLRQPHSGAPGAGSNSEIRFPISFSRFP